MHSIRKLPSLLWVSLCVCLFLCLGVSAHADGPQNLTLLDAIARFNETGEPTEIFLNEEVTVTKNLTIPYGFTVIVESGGALITEEDVTLTNNGTLAVHDDGLVLVYGTLYSNRGEYVFSNLDTSKPHMILENGITWDEKCGFKRIRFVGVEPGSAIDGIDLSEYNCVIVEQPNGDTEIDYVIRKPPLEHMGAMGFAGTIEFHNVDRYTLHEYPNTADINPVVIPEGMVVDAPNTVFVIPDGVTLNVAGMLTVRSFELQGSGKVTPLEGGSVSLALYDPSDADLILPEALTTIESEAFAGGGFTSVYIPASVMSIALDTFGEQENLIVYGAAGSSAETFAADRFTFLPTA